MRPGLDLLGEVNRPEVIGRHEGIGGRAHEHRRRRGDVHRPTHRLTVRGYQFKGVNPQSGLYQFEDLNKDGAISPKSGSVWNDYTIVGTTDPSYYGGLENIFNYKGWQLTFLFQFEKQEGRDAIYANSSLPGIMSNHPNSLLDRWQNSGDNAPYQRYSQAYGDAYFSQYNVTQSTAALTDASFIRLKTLSLSYSLDSRVIQKLKLSNCRLYAQCQNILTITGYKELDPENQSFYSIPPLRMYTVGIQITF